MYPIDTTKGQVPCSPRMQDYQLQQRRMKIQSPQRYPRKHSVGVLPTHSNYTSPHYQPGYAPGERSPGALRQATPQLPPRYPRKSSTGALTTHNNHTSPHHYPSQVPNTRSPGTLGLSLHAGARKDWISTGVTSVKTALRNKRLSGSVTEHENVITRDVSQPPKSADLLYQAPLKEFPTAPVPGYNAFQHVRFICI